MIINLILVSILIIILTISIYFIFYKLDRELFEISNNKNSDPKRLGEDNLFTDTINYDNDPDEDGRTGLDKCLEYCDGACVEYGQSYIATCFPRTKPNINEKSSMTVLPDYNLLMDKAKF
jgi:hypothetical protein